MKYTFVQEFDKVVGLSAMPKTVIRHEVEGDITLYELLEQFGVFLKASGFTFDGYLDIVEDNTQQTETTFGLPEEEQEEPKEYEIGWYNTPDEPGMTRIGVSEK